MIIAPLPNFFRDQPMTLADSIIYGTREDVEIALKENIDVDVNDFDEYGYTPLIEAVIFNKTDIATLLLGA